VTAGHELGPGALDEVHISINALIDLVLLLLTLPPRPQGFALASECVMVNLEDGGLPSLDGWALLSSHLEVLDVSRTTCNDEVAEYYPWSWF
jgi:hypothetical protein